ncbi:MAG: YciI family protein [Chloroflexota bacterium]|nr:YciI family protein [Chloroflexota bacterium]
MPEITDEMMRQSLAKTRSYTIMLLKAGPNISMPGVDKIIWEHGRRNFRLRAAGRLSIICPVADDSGLCGLGIFDADPDEVERIYAADPGVQAGVFTFEVHPSRGFPGSCLPG